MRKTILYGIIVFQILLIISLVKGIVKSKRVALRITSMQEEKAKLEAEQAKIKQEEEYVASSYYLEKVARDELGLAKIGEKVVIIPNDGRQMLDESRKVKTQGEKANWQKWWDVLSGRIWMLESGQAGNASVLKTDERKL